MSFAKPIYLVLALAIAPLSVHAKPQADSYKIDAESRWATFENASNTYFALSVQADPTGDYPQSDAYEVVVLMDTSATQTGPIRLESLEVLEEIGLTLPANASVCLLACDVNTVLMSDGFLPASDPKWETAVARLKKRIPLGTTNLGKALKTALAQFSDATAQRAIVYIGDGVNRTNFLTSGQQRQLVDELVAKKASVSSLAIGPVTDVATLATFANHTGGVLYSRAEIQESAQSIGRNLAMSVLLPVVWVEDAKLPAAIASHFPQQFPPLRVDRDTIVIGESKVKAAAGELVLQGKAAGKSISIRADLQPESSHPDMGFLAAITESARSDGGLTMPALGSAGLRAMSFMLADGANEMVKSGQFALRSGEIESAIRIAEAALKADPNNAEAVSLLNAAKKVAGEQEIPTGKFMQFGGDANGSILSETYGAGDLLAEEEALRRAAAQGLEADVRRKLQVAQDQMSRDPTGVKNSLKLLLEELDGAVDIDASLRAQLRDQVSSSIQIAAAQEARYFDNVQRAETIRAQANQAERLLAETSRTDESLKQLVEQFNFLMTSHRYLEASKDIAPEIGEAAPGTVLDNVTREESSLATNQALLREAFEKREQGFVDVMRAVEEAAIPFEGNPPVIYPPAEVWQALTARRKERYGAINLAGGNSSETKIYAALKQDLDDINYNQQPLKTLMSTLADDLNIPIWVNETELDLLGVDPDAPITLELPPVSLRSALRLMLDPLELTYIIRNEVLEITSKDSADADPINKVYPVGDLVVPPTPMGGGMMGGMGGGMGGMGGGMGGMGGGMGGMGGGMGGMGGGMGGMGGGMMGGMGGMMVVPDDKSKTSANSPLARKALPTQHAASSVNVDEWVRQLEVANDEEKSQLDAKIRRAVQDRVETAKAHLEAGNEAGAIGEFEKAIGITGGLLGAGYPQPWMYQALSLSMEACDYPNDDIQRVLLSGLDFDGDTDKSFEIAEYMARKGMKNEALELLRDIAIVEPQRYDVFALALPLASEARNYDALRWACVGVMSKAWPKEQASLFDQARLLAKATTLRLAQEGRVVESRAFEEEIKSAMLRDIVVRVNWTGEADLDIRVREPAGTICSLANPQTVSGGVLLGDTSSGSEKASIDGFSEYYVCSQGYAGQYDVLIRRVYGQVSGGKATIEIYTDFGTPEQAYISKQIDLSEKDAVVQVAVKNGHRREPLAVADLKNVRQRQLATTRAVLGQLGGDDSSSSAANDYYNFRRALAAGRRRGLGFPVGGGVVGYQPVITTLPEGANMFVTGVVSADRRYVRISPSPQFNGIGEIFTFNFVSGQGGQGGQGGGGFGGGGLGGGGGGGLGGLGGGGGGGIL